MKETIQDNQLIFLISLPRSGSTLLQKILGGHSAIYTRSEPWLMLHPLYALRNDGIEAHYNSYLAAEGTKDFISNLPGDGEEFYYTQLRGAYLSLYAQYLNNSGKTRFLDKTPRYYEVFDELQKIFPLAKFVILYRNPLAVLASILETWVKGNYTELKDYRGDLYKGVEFLQRDFSSYTNTHVIRYEELLLNPECKTEELFKFLQLPNQPECIDYGNKPVERWKYGDPTTVYKKIRPDPQHIDAWHSQLNNEVVRQLLSDYLRTLGKSAFDRAGYNFEDAERAIAKAERKPTNTNNPSSISLPDLLLSDMQLIQQKLEQAESAQKKNAAEIELLQTQNSTYENLLDDKNHEIAARDILILQNNEKINSLTTELSACRSAYAREQFLTQEFENDLTLLLAATAELTAYHFFTHPINKFKAYKTLLSQLNAARKKHARSLKKSQK